MKKIGVLFMSLLLLSFQTTTTLKGTWKFVGGIYNGKKEGQPTEYALQRKYDTAHYEAFIIEKGYKPEKYETGDYFLKGDSCIDIETFSSQPSKITNIPVHYLFSLTKDTLTLKGTLPTGATVEEYWKRIK
jgi:hypothetical protein